jgi:AcrR family transcriptional regulator
VTTAAAPNARPLRRDAARNLERVRQAATELFAEQGLEVGVEEIAARAGVGVGTLYRRFPTKEALICCLIDQLINETLDVGRRALAEPGGHGLEECLRHIGELQMANSGLLPRLWSGGLSAEQREEMRGVLGGLLGQAHAAGTVRPEITVSDISVLLWSLQHVTTMTATIAPNAWRRHLDILLAGLAPGHRDITHQPMTMNQFTAALALNRA